MPNLFEALSLPCELSVTVSEVEDAWRSRSQQYHPDIAGEAGVDISSRLNEARDTLSKPSGRLSEWLAVKSGDTGSSNTALTEGLMALFSDVNGALGEADHVITAMKQAQSALARSLLAPRAIAAQVAIQEQLAKITNTIGEISEHFPDFEKSAADRNFSGARSALGELRFLEKWQRECQQRLVELISFD